MKLLKKTFTERNLVAILFVMVLIMFSFAQQDSKKVEKMFMVFKAKEASPVTSIQKANFQVQLSKEAKEKNSPAN